MLEWSFLGDNLDYQGKIHRYDGEGKLYSFLKKKGQTKKLKEEQRNANYFASFLDITKVKKGIFANQTKNFFFKERG